MSENKSPLISIIVPAYNSEATIERCLDSILNQTVTDFELIVVDDGSKDSTGKICNEFVNRDKRVRVTHQQNGGVSKARNTGLKKATGTWITFVDSDDFLNTNHLSQILEHLAKLCDPDLILFSHQMESKPTAFHVSDCVYRLLNRDTLQHYYTTQVWNYLFKKNILEQHNISFCENLSYAEDALFIFKYTNYIHKILYIDSKSYIYNDLNESATSHITFKRNENHIQAAEEILKDIEISTNFSSLLIYNLLSRFIYCIATNDEISIFKRYLNLLKYRSRILRIINDVRRFNKKLIKINFFSPNLLFFKYLLYG